MKRAAAAGRARLRGIRGQPCRASSLSLQDPAEPAATPERRRLSAPDSRATPSRDAPGRAAASEGGSGGSPSATINQSVNQSSISSQRALAACRSPPPRDQRRPDLCGRASRTYAELHRYRPTKAWHRSAFQRQPAQSSGQPALPPGSRAGLSMVLSLSLSLSLPPTLSDARCRPTSRPCLALLCLRVATTVAAAGCRRARTARRPKLARKRALALLVLTPSAFWGSSQHL